MGGKRATLTNACMLIFEGGGDAVGVDIEGGVLEHVGENMLELVRAWKRVRA